MKPTTLLWCATLVAACASVTPPNPAQTEQLAAARALLDEAPDRAADAAGALLATDPDLRDARLLAAESALRMAKDQRFGAAEPHLRDAVRDFERGTEGSADVDVADALRMLAEAHFALGHYEAGSEAAQRAAAAFTARPGIDNRREAALARLIGARCDQRLFVAARKAEIDGGKAAPNGVVPVEPATAKLGATAIAGFMAARLDFPAEATVQTAGIEQWLGQPSMAIQELERGVREFPNENGIHDALIRTLSESGQYEALLGAYARFVREQPDAPLLRWHAARALYARADQLYRDGNHFGAREAYERARTGFGDYLARMPQHAAATKEWQALCDLQIANAEVAAGGIDRAAEHLLRADETSPAVATQYERQFTQAAFAIHQASTQRTDDALRHTLAFNEALLERHPDRWGFVYNNAALAARDLGVQRDHAGDHDAARELWERAYRHYTKAVELTPDDPRLVNDCGVMLVYHLHRDYEHARELFDRAIELGTKQLDALTAGADAGERQRLEEAVGDALQNIAVLLRDHEHADLETYRPFCERAIKFYPYAAREAAAMLRAQQGGAAEALQKVMPDVDAKMKAADYDGALALLDKLAKTCRDHAPYQLLRGRATWLLATQARETKRRGADLFFQDAVTALQRAVELDGEPIEPRQLLAQAQYDAGDVAAAADTVSSLLLHMQSKGGGTAEQQLAAHKLRASAATRVYVQRRQGEDKDDRELLTAARASLRFLEQQGQLDAATTQLWATTEQWAQAPAEAVNIYVRASERTPNDLGLLDAIVNTAAAGKQLPLAIDALAKRDDAATIWYRAKAKYLLADELRPGGDFAKMLATLDAARADFAAAMAKNGDYRDSCEQWIALCLGKKGNVAVQKGDLANAETWLLESMRMRPDRINDDLGLLETTKRGMAILIDKYFRNDDLKKAAELSLAAAEHAQGEADMQNNAGLFARDYADVLTRGGKAAEAKPLYEQSYKAYRRAVQLDPKSVQLRNDCALIAIHHLDRDWDLAKQMLDDAVADGERMLRDEPPEDADAKQLLESALGDCYENVALWHLKHSHDAAAAKAAAERSLQLFPGARRPGARRHLADAERLLQGK